MQCRERAPLQPVHPSAEPFELFINSVNRVNSKRSSPDLCFGAVHNSQNTYRMGKDNGTLRTTGLRLEDDTLQQRPEDR